jgi:DNA polymerase
VTSARTLLLAHLRQLVELGGRNLYLDDLTAAEFARAVAGWQGLDPVDSATGVAPTAPDRGNETADDVANATQTAGAGPALSGAAATADPALRVLAADAATCTRCRLHESRTTVVFGEGSPVADVVVVGEAPGQEEDRTGRPFVGRAGRLLDLLLLSIGFPREHVYICNVLKCRPPNNRNPLPDEVDECTTRFLHSQLEAIRPRVILAVGRFAAQALAGSDAAIGRLRGRVHVYRGVPLVVSYHPAYLLRSPHMMPAAWDDLQLLRKVLDEQS